MSPKKIMFLALIFVMITARPYIWSESKDIWDTKNLLVYQEKNFIDSSISKYIGWIFRINSKNQLVIYDRGTELKKYVFVNPDGKKAGEISQNFKGRGEIFTLDARDNLYALIQSETNPKKRLAIYNASGKLLKTLDLGKLSFQEPDHAIEDILVDMNGNIYLLNQRAGIQIIDKNGKTIKIIKLNSFVCFDLDSDGDLIMSEKGDKFAYLEKMTPLTGKILWKKELGLSDYPEIIKFNRYDKSIYVMNLKGVKKYNLSGEFSGAVLDFKQTSLLENDSPIDAMGIDAAQRMYFIAFYSGKQYRLYQYTKITDQKPDKKKILALTTRVSDPFLEFAVSKFQKVNPSLQIDIKDFAATSGISSFKDIAINYQKKTNVEIMSGKGADIIEVSLLPYKKYIEKGILANLSDMMARDKEFQIEDYYTNIMDACKYNNNLYIMPIGFTFDTLVSNEELLNKANLAIEDQNWTCQDFAAITAKLTHITNNSEVPSQYALPKMDGQTLFSFLFNNNAGYFIDYDRKKANFNSPEFIKLLELCKEILDKKLCSPKNNRDAVFMNAMNNNYDPDNIVFVPNVSLGYDKLIYDRIMVNGKVCRLHYPKISQTKERIFSSYRLYAINKHSKYLSEAWKFLKFLISQEIQSSQKLNLYQFAINKHAQQQTAGLLLDKNYHVYQYFQTRNIKPVTREDIDFFDNYIKELNEIRYFDLHVTDIINAEVTKYFNGEKVAAEVAKVIQDKVDTYFGE